MLGIPSKFWKDVLTENDGESYELQRFFIFGGLLVWVISFFWGAGLETYHVMRSTDHAFDMPSFFEGIAYHLGAGTILIGGGGASLYWKMKTENCPPSQPVVEKTKTPTE